jgi:NADH dehydrogenase
METIVIIGGGFAGLHLARRLNGVKDYRVVLVDRQNHYQFQPLFYQVACARLEPANISFPFRKIFQRSGNVEFRMGEVEEIDPSKKVVHTTAGSVAYNHLVIATGCTTNFFNNSGLAENAMPMKSTTEAIDIRNEILLTFERYISSTPPEREALLNVVIVGGGPTGVELSGAFAEMKKYILPRDYPQVDFSGLSVILIEGSPHTLNSMSDVAKKASRRFLQEQGVDIRTESIVSSYDGYTLTLKSGEQIKSRNVIWAAGVTGNVIKGLNSSVIRHNRYTVNRYNQVQGYENIYAIGDIAYMETPLYPQGHPQLANVAINQGKNLARNLMARLRNRPLEEYEYKDLGSMATVGKHKAVVDLPWLKFSGRVAWYAWMFLHLMLILSVRNKLMIFMNWAWNYLSRDSSLRLIFKPLRRIYRH